MTLVIYSPMLIPDITCMYRVTVCTRVLSWEMALFHHFLLAVCSNYTISKYIPPLACHNFDTREPISIMFGRNANEKVNSN